MLKFGSVTGHVTITLGNTPLPGPVVEFAVPLRAVDTTKLTDAGESFDIYVDRTEFRGQLMKTLRGLADRIEASFLTPDAHLLTCAECGLQMVAPSPATLRHEADGAHSLSGPAAVTS